MLLTSIKAIIVFLLDVFSAEYNSFLVNKSLYLETSLICLLFKLLSTIVFNPLESAFKLAVMKFSSVFS